jgi:hypothetical protein
MWERIRSRTHSTPSCHAASATRADTNSGRCRQDGEPLGNLCEYRDRRAKEYTFLILGTFPEKGKGTPDDAIPR